MTRAIAMTMTRILAVLSCLIALGAASASAQPQTKPQSPAKPPVAAKPPAEPANPPGQQAYATPKEALDTMVEAIRRGDTAQMQKLFGNNYRNEIQIYPEDVDLLRKKFVELADAGSKVNTEGDSKATLEFGKDGWTFPIPLAKRADGWRFDMAAGAEEIGNRQIGRNELALIQVMLAIVDAQQEYFEADPMKTGAGQYARRFLSSPGKKDGLYWPEKPGEPESPLGDLVAQAQKGGAKEGDGYHGYHYRMLYAQGPNAPGGAQDYIVNGRMIGGFAVIAWPVAYGETGNMTFVVSHDGAVYEKNLGPNTEAVAAQIKAFDPDKSWTKADTTP
jgi:hypothetical protein